MKKKYPASNARPKHLLIINAFRQEKQYVMMFENKTEMEDWKSVLQDVLQNVKEKSLKLKKLPVDRKDDEDYLPRLPAGMSTVIRVITWGVAKGMAVWLCVMMISLQKSFLCRNRS